MFGFKTIVVGNMPNTKVAAAIAAANEQDDSKIDSTEIVRVFEWAWLGDWIAQVLPIREALDNDDSVKLSELTVEFPQLESHWSGGDIPGAPKPEDFYLSIGMACEQEQFDREECAYVAAESLFKVDEDELELIYGVILTEETYTKKNSKLMLREISQKQWSFTNEGLAFKIRVFVVKNDGSVEMYKL